jgi:hypothetical protein
LEKDRLSIVSEGRLLLGICTWEANQAQDPSSEISKIRFKKLLSLIRIKLVSPMEFTEICDELVMFSDSEKLKILRFLTENENSYHVKEEDKCDVALVLGMFSSCTIQRGLFMEGEIEVAMEMCSRLRCRYSAEQKMLSFSVNQQASLVGFYLDSVDDMESNVGKEINIKCKIVGQTNKAEVYFSTPYCGNRQNIGADDSTLIAFDEPFELNPSECYNIYVIDLAPQPRDYYQYVEERERKSFYDDGPCPFSLFFEDGLVRDIYKLLIKKL